MAGFLYFHAQPGRVGPQELAELGLDYAFDGATPTSNLLKSRSPADAPGCLFADLKRLGKYQLDYRPDEQQWRKIPGELPLWIGHYQAAVPTPEDLARPKMLDGELVELADGRKWQVPRVARLLRANNLPRAYDLDENGEWCLGGMAPEHERLWELVGEFVDAIEQAIREAPTDGDTATVTYSTKDGLEASAELLRANYVVSRHEIAMLRLIRNDDCADAVLRAAADFATFETWAQKKSAAAGDG